jgi:hypothetical protein
VLFFPFAVTIAFTTAAYFMNFGNNTYINNSTPFQNNFLVSWVVLFTISLVLALIFSHRNRITVIRPLILGGSGQERRTSQTDIPEMIGENIENEKAAFLMDPMAGPELATHLILLSEAKRETRDVGASDKYISEANDIVNSPSYPDTKNSRNVKRMIKGYKMFRFKRS